MYQRILVPLDTSSTSQCGLREAIRLAADQKARLLILHVVDDFTTLVETARSFIPVIAPDWTDHNLHDPGIMLLELLA